MVEEEGRNSDEQELVAEGEEEKEKEEDQVREKTKTPKLPFGRKEGSIKRKRAYLPT